MTGTVKWFDSQKGFGFIAANDGQEVFVHHSAILGQKGRRNLSEMQQVEFRIEHNDRGPKAADVRVIDDAPKQTGNPYRHSRHSAADAR